MTPITTNRKNRISQASLTVAGLGLIFCAGARPARAQQNQPSEVRAAMEQQDAQTQPQDAQPQEQTNPQAQERPNTQAVQPNQSVPLQALTLPAGTVVRVRVDEWLSSDHNSAGDSFSAVLEQPIVVDGWVVARRGQAETGRVSSAKKGGHGSGTSQLGLDLPTLTLVDGQQLPLQTQLFQTSAGTSQGQDATAVGVTSGVGAAIGAIADGGVGAGIGAGVGAAAGMIGVLAARGRPAVVAPETVLSFRLQSPVTISTEKSQLAFQPVTQADYDSHAPQNRPRLAPGPPAPPYYGYPYAYGYPYPYLYPYAYYPGPFVGFGFYGRFGGFRR